MGCQLRFAFCLVGPVTRALMRSCFFTCSASADAGGQDGLRRDERPSFAARSIDFANRQATNYAGSSTPRTHQGAHSPPIRRMQVDFADKNNLRHLSAPLLLGCPTELGSVDPHAMQDHRELR
jgi:hypothetical protein